MQLKKLMGQNKQTKHLSLSTNQQNFKPLKI